ncbi:hypothetical protein [Nannocystis pusilla]|uniref:hypothetical protein n=1 Tax=Nannocystis pusilla TaxID=889268 RepID=UPI003B7695A2
MVLGTIIRWGIREQLPRLEGWRLWAVRACWVAFGLGCLAVVLITLPVHHVELPKSWWTTQRVQIFTAVGWIALMAAIGALFWFLNRRPPTVKIRGKRYVLDLDWFCRWFLGRRVWLTCGLVFHGNLQLLMNIGMFPPIMMSTYLFFLQGDEPGRILRFFGRGLAKAFPWLPLPADVRRGEPPLPAEDRTLPHHRRDGRRLPPTVLYGMLVAAIVGVILQASPLVPWFKVSVLGREETTGANLRNYFTWTLIAMFSFMTIYTYVQGQRGTKHFVVKLLGLAAGIAAYLWVMSWTGETTQEKDQLLYYKLAASGTLLLVFCLNQVPAIHRHLAKLGLTFSPPDRPKREPDMPAIDPQTGHTIAPWSYGPGGRLLVGSLVLYHVIAIAIWELPEKDCISTFRIKAREPFSTWVLATQTDQQWGMFAPNPAPQRADAHRRDRRDRRALGPADRHLRARAQADPVGLERPHAQDEPAHHRRRVGQGRLVPAVVRALHLPPVGAEPPRRDAAEGRALQGLVPHAGAGDRRQAGLVRAREAALRHRPRGAAAHHQVRVLGPRAAAQLHPRAPRPAAARGGRVQAVDPQQEEGVGQALRPAEDHGRDPAHLDLDHRRQARRDRQAVAGQG